MNEENEYTTPEGLVIPQPDAVLRVLDCTRPRELHILRTVCSPLKEEEAKDEGYQKLIPLMIKTMLESGGIGLAAIQVGVPKRIIVAKDLFNGKPIVVLNPVLTSRVTQTQESTEQCLSVPGLSITVTRPFNIEVKGKTLDWQDYENEFQYEAAAVFSHENDHLNGKLLIDNLGSLQLKMYLEKVKKIRKKARRLAKQYVKEQSKLASEEGEES